MGTYIPMVNSTVLSILVLVVIAWNLWSIRRLYGENESDERIWPILLLAAMILIFMSADSGLHDWDERYHALVGKNLGKDFFKPMLLSNPVLEVDPANWSLGHIWLHKQPFVLWCMALSMKLFGASVYAARLPSLVFTLVAVFCTYKIGCLLFSKRAALVATFFHATNGLVMEIASGRISTDHVDAVFMALVEVSILCGLLYWQKEKRRFLLLMGLSCGLAVLTKWLTGLLVFPIMGYLMWSDGTSLMAMVKRLSVAFIVAILVFLPWQLFILVKYPEVANLEYAYNRLHLTVGVEGHTGPLWYYLDSLRMVLGETLLVVFVFVGARFFKKRTTEIGMLLVWLFIPLLFFSVAATKMKGYMLIAYPALFLLMGLTLEYLFQVWQRAGGTKKIGSLAGMLLLLLLPVRYSIERMKLFEDRTLKSEWLLEAEEFCELTEDLKKQPLVFADEKYVQLMFACEAVTAYPFAYTPAYLEQIDTAKYAVFTKEQGRYVPVGF